MDTYAEIAELLERAGSLALRSGLGDILSYARSKELMIAQKLGHKLAPRYSGGDAFNEAGEEVEYKSTTAKKCKGTYSGVSVQTDWPSQERYLREEKIGKYSEHYFNRFEDGKMVESWKVSGQDVFDILLPKFKKKFPTVLSKKDPRLSATVTWNEIQQYGEQVYPLSNGQGSFND